MRAKRELVREVVKRPVVTLEELHTNNSGGEILLTGQPLVLQYKLALWNNAMGMF